MRRILRSDNGIALVMVVFIISLAFLFIVALVNYNNNYRKNVVSTAQMEDALKIAEAGYNHYMYYLNQDSDFFKNPQGIDIPGPYGQEGFKPVSLDDGLPVQYDKTVYRIGDNIIGYYEIRVIQPAVNEELAIISTGWTAENENIKKSIRVKLHKRTFAEYVDFTDSSGDVRWITGNEAHGPVFCNGDILVDGNPTFHDNVYTAGELKILSGAPNIIGNKYEGKDGIVPAVFPATNTEMENWAKNGGIHLTGRTCIFIDGDTLTIRNKNHNDDNAFDAELPRSGVVFVNGPIFISGILDGMLTVYATEDIYITAKDPTNFDPTKAAKTGKIQIGSIDYDIGIGYQDTNIPLNKDASGSGYSDDMLGLISEKNIYVATRTWPTSNAQGYVTYDINSKTRKDHITMNNLIIYGALMSGARSKGGQFTVESYDKIEVRGKVSVYGSKIQNDSRGPVGTYNSSGMVSGYSKLDWFDYRLKTMSPPHFVEPANSGWEVRSWEEVPNP